MNPPTGSGAENSDASIFLWGEIPDPELVVDLVSFMTSSRRSAVLTVVERGVRKSVYFRDGSIIAASSNQPEDRFGDIMYRRAMITRDQLDTALARVGPGKKIGNVLLASGLINSGDLWKMIKLQIEEILFSVLLLESGRFTLATYEASSVPTRTALDTQHVLLEGMRRKDELTHLQRQLPPQDTLLRQTGRDGEVDLSPPEARVMGLVDGRSTVGQVFRRSGLGDFATARALFRMLEEGLLSAAAKPPPMPVTPAGEAGGGGTSVGSIISGYNEAFARVHRSLVGAPGSADYRSGLSTFFLDAEPTVAGLFEDVVASPDGRLPTQKIFANLKVSKAPNKPEILRRGLREYLRFLLFMAREGLPFEAVERLAGEVRGTVRGL